MMGTKVRLALARNVVGRIRKGAMPGLALGEEEELVHTWLAEAEKARFWKRLKD
jgi:hypothetical protein